MSLAVASRRMMVATLVVMLAGVSELSGQVRASSQEYDLLREAGALEAAGDYGSAERVLTDLLQANPESLTGLLQLERVLLVQGRAQALLPVVDNVLRRDASSALAHQMRVRALAVLDRGDELEQAGEEWIAATPSIEVPYRELARVHRERHELDRAIALLERGRETVPRRDALALELGEAYALAGRWKEAAAEWARAIGPDARGLHAVERRLRVLADGGARVLPHLVDALDHPSASLSVLRAASVLAIDAGLRQRARAIARRAAEPLEASARETFLVEVARRADGAGLTELAYWAYGELDGLQTASDEQRWAVRARLADLALMVGDTAKAAEIYRAMERAFDAGSPERRSAMAVRVRLAARDGDPASARRTLSGLRREYPRAPELDAAAAEVAAAYLRSGDTESAEAVLEGVSGPNAARVRGLLALGQGDLAQARLSLLGSVPGLRAADATQVIALAALLLRVTPEGGALLAELMVEGQPRTAPLAALPARSRHLPARERAAILDFAAEAAQAGGLDDAADALRRILIEEHRAAPETPTAMLALARTTDAEEARLLLARLIVDYPRSALVPQARRELDRLATAAETRR